VAKVSRRSASIVARPLEILLAPLTLVGALWLRFARHFGLEHLPVTRAILFRIGLMPVRHHYYEPFVLPSDLNAPLAADRDLPGLDLNVTEQLETLARFRYGTELLAMPEHGSDVLEYHYHNGSFESGDAEFLYSAIRSFKPRRVVEVGSGHSTKIARAAILRNRSEDSAYACDHVCIEPYEMPWLERLGVRVLRQRVETVSMDLFLSLQADDVLFIDSSHVIRPQGDVLFEYLSLLPRLRPGVLVHVHDIFTPRDYLEDWVLRESRIWNEQYLLEALLTQNPEFRVIGALNYLTHHHPEAVAAAFPVLGRELAAREPGSFWFVRN
jgi:hypothetical protein